MFCSNCGEEIKEGMTYCTKCGKALAPKKNEEKTQEIDIVQLVIVVVILCMCAAAAYFIVRHFMMMQAMRTFRSITDTFMQLESQCW